MGQGVPLESIPDFAKLAPAVGSVINNLTLNLVAGQLQVFDYRVSLLSTRDLTSL